jgi:LPS-assembly lipoprotein
MWWFKPSRRGLYRGGAMTGLLLSAAVLLSACGFQPLYGGSGTGRTPADELAAVRIDPLPDRIGQQMHNLLRDRLNPQGQPNNPAYVLRVTIAETREELGVRKDETATRANLILSAKIVLHDAESNDVLLDSNLRSINSYNIVANQFATTVSEQDARDRALRELSEDVRTRLAVYFSQVQQGAL